MRNFLLESSAICLLLALGDAAQAQQSSSSPQDESSAETGSAGDIVVTARRRDESLQKVPVAVTVLSGEQLKERSTVDIRDVGAATPNLRIEQGGRSSNVAFVSLRGQENTNQTIANDPAVGIYFNEVYSGRSAGNMLGSLLDVQSVQVLRGVQGTLFGRNNTGGAILITSNAPTLSGVHADLALSYGSYDRFTYEGVTDLTLSEGKLGIRAAYQGIRQDPIGYSVTTGIGYGNRHREQGRISLRWMPTDNATFDLVYDTSKVRENGSLATSVLNLSPAGFYSTAAGIRNPVAYAFVRGYTFRGEVEVSDAVKLKAIVGRRILKTQTDQDSDGAAPSLIDAGFVSNQDQWTAEVQLSGTVPMDAGWLNSIDYTAGFFYFWEQGDDNTQVPYNTIPVVQGRTSRTHGENQSVAGYAQIEAQTFDQLFLSAGARYTSDKRQLSVSSTLSGACALVAFPTTTPPTLCRIYGSADFGYWSYTAGARYEVSDDINVYAKYDRGQRAGGLDDEPTRIVSFAPEIITGFEAGIKTLFWNRRIRANLAAFSNKIDNVQRVSQLTDSVGQAYLSVFNAARARTRGIELDVSVSPVRGLTFEGSLGLLDAKYTRFVDPRPGPGRGQDLSSFKFPDTPDTTYSLAASYSVPLSDSLTGSLRIDYSYRSQVTFDPYNAPVTFQNGYGLLNGRVELVHSPSVGGGQLRVAAYGRNLTDKQYNAWQGTLVGGTFYRSDQPRTFGVEARYSF